LRASIVDGESVIGGGATPERAIPSCLIAIDCDAVACERKLRAGSPPIVARIENHRLVIDLRTVFREEEADLADALAGLP
jgi:L-seryl-tRNA(Ser) seleniumtransferase